MNPLPARVAATLLAVFIVVAAALSAVVMATDSDGISVLGALALVALALAVAWAALLPVTREAARMAAELAERNQRLAAAQRQQSELLGKVSHDLRTPLASVRGYLELLLLRQGELEGAEAQNYLQTAVRQSARLTRLVDDLLELTRLESEGAAAACEPFLLAELVQDVLQRFDAEARQRGVVLRAEGCTSGGEVLADLPLVERVLANLVENALRHTPEGGQVTVRLAREAGRTQVTVSDTGEGIPAEALPTVLEHYLHAPRVGDGGGHAGLGLAIAQRIATLHGSRLDLRSTPGTGTCVSFDLPRPGPRAGAS